MRFDCIQFFVPVVASSTRHQINHGKKIKDGVHYKRTLKFVTSLKFATIISTPLFHRKNSHYLVVTVHFTSFPHAGLQEKLSKFGTYYTAVSYLHFVKSNFCILFFCLQFQFHIQECYFGILILFRLHFKSGIRKCFLESNTSNES